MSEREEFEQLVALYKPCKAASDPNDACACTGGCLGFWLARLRMRYDRLHKGPYCWYSDQGHCSLLKREGDSGRHGAPLTAENYWTGAV